MPQVPSPTPKPEPIRVEVTGMGIVEFPAGTSPQEMQAAIEKQLASSNTAEQTPPAKATSFAGDVATGITQGIGRTLTGLGELVHKVPGVSAAVDSVYGTPGLSKQAFPIARAGLAPQNTGQAIGQGAEQIAEFFIPATAVTKIRTAAQTGRGFLDALLGAGLEAGSAAAVQTAQQGGTQGTAGTAGFAAGASLAAPVVGKGLKFLGDRIEMSLVKPSVADVKDGFKVQNVYKHQLGGSLSQTYDKATAKLIELGQQMKQTLRAFGGPTGPQVDVLQVLADTSAELSKNQAKTYGQNINIASAITKLLDDPAMLALKNGKADLVTANEMKQALGEMGAWQYGARDADSNAMEIAANVMYTKLKEAIEKALPIGPTRVRSLNQQMAEIIPVRQAVIRRIPVEQRQNVLKMGDVIGLATGNIWLSVMNRFLMSGQGANVANKAGQLAPGLAPIGAQAVAGSVSQVRRDPNE